MIGDSEYKLKCNGIAQIKRINFQLIDGRDRRGIEDATHFYLHGHHKP